MRNNSLQVFQLFAYQNLQLLLLQKLRNLLGQNLVHMRSHMPIVKPRILIQRQTSITLRRLIDIRLIVTRTISRDVLDVVFIRVIQDIVQEGIDVKGEGIGGWIVGGEGVHVRGQGGVPPVYHGGVGGGGGFEDVSWCAVQGW